MTKGRFCPKGHDQDNTGRRKNGRCAECNRIAVREWARRNPERAAKRFCLRGHDTQETGRYKNSHCMECNHSIGREWRRRNPEKNRESTRRWALANPERCCVSSGEWARRNPERRRAYRRKYRHAKIGITQQVAEAVRGYYGPACVYCLGEAAGFDHLYPVSKGGTSDILNLAPCCAVCNARKGDRPIWVMAYPWNNPFSPDFVARGEGVSVGHQ